MLNLPPNLELLEFPDRTADQNVSVKFSNSAQNGNLSNNEISNR